MTTAVARMNRDSTGRVHALVVRIQGEYDEMPGLSLTVPQARRLWGLDGETCAAVIEILLNRGFLKRTDRGAYVRAQG